MLNEDRVKVMTKIASFECGEGAEGLKIGSFFQKDYISYHVIATLIWITVGYGIILSLVGVIFMDFFIKSMSAKLLIMLAAGVIIVWILLLLIYGLSAHTVYKKRYIKARRMIKNHNLNLMRLNKIYEKEKL